jgi:sugar transferase (PEP-CTERM/EpsH1 system associated)
VASLSVKPEILREVARDTRPLVMHVVHRFDTGGLENGVVNLINRMAPSAYRHVVLALSTVTDFRHRVQRDDVGFIALNKAPGHGARAYPAVARLLRQLQPAVVHTRNLGPLEMQVPAAWQGVPLRIHGEHGRDLNDLDGNNRTLQWVRRVYSPMVHRYVALSRDLERYLVGRVGISGRRISQVYNGVDTECFKPDQKGQQAIAGCPFDPARHWLVGTVGRMQGVKHQTSLTHAFVQALAEQPALRARTRLVLVGDGPLRAECQRILQAAQLSDWAWLPGERSDVADVMRGLNCFALPSLAEGISNTILEAMASALPVVATDVGGNAELVAHGRSGLVVPSDDVAALSAALGQLASQPAMAQTMGQTGRALALERYSLDAMVASYQKIYDLQQKTRPHAVQPTTT